MTERYSGRLSFERDWKSGSFEFQVCQSARNIVLVGGTGTGKSHLAIAIASSAIQKGMRGRFFTVIDLVQPT